MKTGTRDSGSGATGDAARVLVMDDEAIVRDVMSQILREFGHRVDGAAEGGEALELFARAARDGEPYAAAILDLTVPSGLGGRETARRLRELDAGVRIIVTSGYVADPALLRCEESGFDAALSKPFSFEELGRLLGRLLEGRRHPGAPAAPGTGAGPSRMAAEREGQR